MAFPTAEDRKLQETVRGLREKIDRFDAWVVEHAPDRAQSGKPLPEELPFQLLDLLRRARNLAAAASVPPAVVLYGASQCGKSLLVGQLIESNDPDKSALGISDTDPLAEKLSFVCDLNPQLGAEATVLPTRFTLSERANIDPCLADKYPVVARLMAPSELLKAMGRGFLTECGGKWECTEASLRALLKQVQGTYGGSSASPEWRAELLDAYCYFSEDMRHPRLKASPLVLDGMLQTTPLTEDGYMELACQLLWEDWPPISQLYRQLRRLRTEKYAGVERILMSWHVVHFILDSPRYPDYRSDVLSGSPDGEVQWAKVRLRTEGSQKVLGYGGDGETEDLTLFQSIVAELQIPLRAERLKADGARLLQHADCLDLPGPRCLAGPAWPSSADLEAMEAWEQGAVVLHALKRGRAGMMFDKYAAESQASALLYLQAGRLEAWWEIPSQINRWGRARFGELWPNRLPAEERAAPSLLVGLTKPVRGFLVLAPDTNFFEGWLRYEIAFPFSSWIDSYGSAEEKFRNVFLLRFPGTLDRWQEGEFDLSAWREAFLASPVVRDYVAQPEAKWAAAFEAGDGGLGFLISAMLPKLDNESRRRELEKARENLRSALEGVLRGLWAAAEGSPGHDELGAMLRDLRS